MFFLFALQDFKKLNCNLSFEYVTYYYYYFIINFFEIREGSTPNGAPNDMLLMCDSILHMWAHVILAHQGSVVILP